MDEAFGSLVVVVIVSALAPLIADLLPGKVRVPQVVLLLAGGIVIGPEVLDIASADDISLLATIGMGFLFLLAGYELDPKIFRESAGRTAAIAWVVTAVIAVGAALALYATGVVGSPIVIGIALSTTALGTLIPILKESKLLGTPLGKSVLAVGAVGELAPIVTMALFLGTRGTLVAIIALVLFLAVVVGAALMRAEHLPPRIRRIMVLRAHSTSQLVLRLVIAVLFILLFVSSQFGFDSVLGAFAAGMLLRRWSGSAGDMRPLEQKLDAVGYGFFIPLFFVYSGITLDVRSIVANPLPLLAFFVALLLIRGAPALFWYRKQLPLPQRTQLMFFSATTLPLLVALTEIGARNGSMSEPAQASVIGAGVLSVLVFPIAATLIGKAHPQRVDSLQPAD